MIKSNNSNNNNNNNKVSITHLDIHDVHMFENVHGVQGSSR